MLRENIDYLYYNELLQMAVKQEKKMIQLRYEQESIKDVFEDRSLRGFKGFSNMTISELEEYLDIDPEYATKKYLQIFTNTIAQPLNSPDLDFLLQLLAEKNIQTKKLSPRKAALLNHLKDVMPNEEYEIFEPCPGDETVYGLKEKNGELTYFKVYTEEECIVELADWYESDIKYYLFPVEHIAETLSMSKETVLALGLLDNVTDALVGDGTEQLLDLLKKLNLLQVLAAYSKEDNFMVLAKDHYAYKVGNYYILEEEDHYEDIDF